MKSLAARFRRRAGAAAGRCLAVVLAGALAWAGPAGPAAGAGAAGPVDWVEIAVDEEAVTYSEFVAQASFLLAWQQPGWAAAEPLAASLAALVRDLVVASMLVAAQARALGIDELGEDEVEGLVEALRRQRPDLRVSAGARALLARHHRNAAFLRQRLRPAGGAADAGADGAHLWLGQANEELRAYLAELYRGARVRVRGERGAVEPPPLP